MTRAQERQASRQQAVTRQKLDDIERAIAESSEPPDGILPWAHRAYVHRLMTVRDDLRRELGLSPTEDAGGRA